MTRYCTHCAAEVEEDAKYCPTCRAPIGVAAALAGELSAGTAKTFRDLKNDPVMAVPIRVWAAVWEVLTTITLFVLWYVVGLWYVVARVGMMVGSADVFRMALGAYVANVESALVWTQFAILFLGLGVGTGVTLSYGLLTERSWSNGLYLWTKPLFIGAGLLLMLTIPTPEGGGLLAVRMVQYLLVGVGAAVQIYLILAIRKGGKTRG